jgi:hypothetical protein
MTRIERDGKAPKINANVVVGLLRRAYASGGEGKLRSVAKAVITGGLTDEQIIKIATNRATLHGVSPGPIEYVERAATDIRIAADKPAPAKGRGPFNREPRVTPKPRR